MFSLGVAVAYGSEPVTIRMFYWPGPESDAMQVVLDWYIENVTPTSDIKPELVLRGRIGYYEKLDGVVAGACSVYSQC